MDEEIHAGANSTSNKRSVESVISDMSSRGYRAWERHADDGEAAAGTSSTGKAPTPQRRPPTNGIMSRYNSTLNRLSAAGVDDSGSDRDSRFPGKGVDAKVEDEDHAGLDMSASGISSSGGSNRRSPSFFMSSRLDHSRDKNVPYGAHHASKRLLKKKLLPPTRCGNIERAVGPYSA